MAKHQFPLNISVDRELVAIRNVRADEDGYLILAVADRTLGPPVLMTDLRKPFVAFASGTEGGGETIMCKLERGRFMFWRERVSMTVDGDGPEDEWVRSRSRKSKLFAPLVSDNSMHHYYCLQLHPLVAYTMLGAVARCIIVGLMTEESKSLESSMLGLSKMISAATAPDPEPIPPGLDSLLQELALGYAVPQWMRAIRASLRGRTMGLYEDSGD